MQSLHGMSLAVLTVRKLNRKQQANLCKQRVDGNSVSSECHCIPAKGANSRKQSVLRLGQYSGLDSRGLETKGR